MNAKKNWTAFVTIVRKEIIRFMRVWIQTLIPPAVTMTLYFAIFGRLIGSQIAPIQGVSYMQYISPGLIMMGVVTSSYANTVTSFYMAKFQKSIEEMLVSPMPNYVLLIGHVVGGVVRGLCVGLIVTLISLLFTKMEIHHFFIMLMVVIMTATLFSLAGFINAVYAKSFDDISIVPTFVLTPLTYLGGVFYSINLLPEGLKLVSRLNPILYMVNAFRFGVIGISDIPIGHAISLIFLFIVGFYLYALHLLRKGKGIRV